MNSKPKDEFKTFFAFLGLALTSWTKVEDAHFTFLWKMLGINKDMSSVVYFSAPSFEARRALVDRIATLYLDAAFQNEWRKLNKRLETASSWRGQMAHYGADYEVIQLDENDPMNFELGEVRLRPSAHDHVKILQGKTGEKHTVTVGKIRNYLDEFENLKQTIEKFTFQCRPKRNPEDQLQSPLPPLGLLGHLFPAATPSTDPPYGE